MNHVFIGVIQKKQRHSTVWLFRNESTPDREKRTRNVDFDRRFLVFDGLFGVGVRVYEIKKRRFRMVHYRMFAGSFTAVCSKRPKAGLRSKEYCFITTARLRTWRPK
ncbi:hypothetical protein EVAR_4069_1 [Eumeta japonica]|uniref:Uncharacterized protein n=1 Tax=Eumeta variegata TaxID=151549 RepID=A0A4C1T6Z6_EUMVA|nr:hypothetical protein EVAR_4069_1 [Eumeta japonica]